MNDFLLSIKKIVDTLAAVGSLITDSEHIQVILDGLPEEYDSIVASILSRTDPYEISEIEALLMAIEERIERHKKPDPFGIQDLQANLMQNQQYRRDRGGGYGGNRAPSSFNSYNSSRGGGRFRGSSSRGRGRNSNRGGRSSSNKPQCQVCDKYAHIALNCWHRFNEKYQDTSVSNGEIHSSGAMVTENIWNDNSNKSALMALPETVYDSA